MLNSTNLLSRRAALGLMASAGAITTLPAFAQTPPTFTRNGLAIGGYDPVAYHTIGMPVRGKEAFSSNYEGATWHFHSAEHKALFDANPAKYAPAYGGYCAYAVSRGYTAKIEPEAWSIYNDRLYLNYSRSVRALWELNKSGNVTAGDKNWPAVLSNG